MSKSASRDARLGIGLFVGATLLVFAVLVAFAKYPAFFRSGREYRSTFRNVAGLNRGDEVRYGGLVVGSVTAMDVDSADPTRISVSFRVRRKAEIHADTRAGITQVGLLGEQYLNLTPGHPDSPLLPPGSVIPSDDNMSFADALTQLSRFMQRTDTLMSALQQLARTNPLERVDRTFDQVDVLLNKTGQGSERVIAQLDSVTHQLNSVLAHTDRVLTIVDTTLRGAGPQLSTTQREAMTTLKETRALVTEMRGALQQGGGLDQLMRNLAITTDNLARLTTRLEQDPTSVLKRRQAPVKTVGPSARE